MKHALAHAVLIVSICLPIGLAHATTTVSANKLVFKGLELRDVKCSLKDEAKTSVLGPFGLAVAAQKEAYEACDREGGAYRVGWKWKAGKVRSAAVRKAANRKSKRCIAKSLKLVNPGLTGSCRATIVVAKTAEPVKPAPTPDAKPVVKPDAKPKAKPATKAKPTRKPTTESGTKTKAKTPPTKP